MRLSGWVVLAALALAGCGDSRVGSEPDGGSGGMDAAADAGIDAARPAGDADVDGGVDAAAPPASDAAIPPDTGAPSCLSKGCPPTQECCASTGRCYDARCLACCMFGP